MLKTKEHLSKIQKKTKNDELMMVDPIITNIYTLITWFERNHELQSAHGGRSETHIR